MKKLSDEEVIIYQHAMFIGNLDLANIRQMASELLQLREQTRWVPVIERLPEKSVLVLIAYTPRIGAVYIAVKAYYGGDWIDEDYDYWIDGTCVTHWMPLPPAPEVAIIRSCNNPECGWRGSESECVDYKRSNGSASLPRM